MATKSMHLQHATSEAHQHHGFFTPLYQLASVFISPNDLMMSMKAATGGSTYTLFLGAASLGAVIHMMIGAM